MENPIPPIRRLCEISTHWTELALAQCGAGAESVEAQKSLLLRYLGAVHRYLLGAVRDSEAADELTQEFALKFLGGAFRHADSSRGRFRDYIRTSLVRMVIAHQRTRSQSPQTLAAGVNELADPESSRAAYEREFDSAWRDELLGRAWAALARSKPVTYDVLIYRIEHPADTSAQIATALASRLGRPYRADQVRKSLQRAHEQFADILLREVADSLGSNADDLIADELRALGLWPFCKDAFAKRAARHAPPNQED